MKTPVIILFIGLSFCIRAQRYPSVCTGPATIEALYDTDAARLAVRQEYKSGDTYKDSVLIRASLKQRYKDALMAVYNLTVLPVADTVINQFNIHTNGRPGLTSLNIVANPALAWMQQLQLNQPADSSAVIKYLVNKFTLNSAYIQTSNGAMVSFYPPVPMNLVPLVQMFSAETTIDTVYADETFNVFRNIEDSLDNNFVELRYSVGWGLCNTDCKYRHYWIFRVYNNCDVEFMGHSGPAIYTGINEQNKNGNISLFPNPAGDKVTIKNATAGTKLNVYSATGLLVREYMIDTKEHSIDVSEFNAGLYLFELCEDNERSSFRILVR